MSRPVVASLLYCLFALLLAAVGGGWIGLGRVDPALILPGLGWATALASLVQPPRTWRDIILRSAALVAMAMLCVLLLAGGGQPWAQYALLAVVALLLNGIAWGVSAQPWITRRDWGWLSRLLLVFAAGLVVQFIAWRGLPFLYEPRPSSAAKPDIIVLSGLPLAAESKPFDALLEDARAEPVVAEMARIARLRFVDHLSLPADASAPSVLMVIHPKALAPDQLVMIDSYVRHGGKALILADGLSSWPAPYPAGDARNPVITSLLTPLLTHWGVTLDAPAGLVAREEAVWDDGMRLTLFSPGQFHAADTQCRLRGGRALAECRIGAGRALLVADADWLAAPYWAGVSKRGPAHWRAANMQWLPRQIHSLTATPSTPDAIFAPVWAKTTL